MNTSQILSCVDHTLLKQTATWNEIKELCDDGIKYHVASVCIPASYVKPAVDYVRGRIPVCTVIGFPNGYSTTETKCFESADAIRNGAKEIDMVINIGALKDGRIDEVFKEILSIRKITQGQVLKVIVETCLLTFQEKLTICSIVSESGADYIKTSTGFSISGATFEDVALFAANVKNGLKIKAAGGISSLGDAEHFLDIGASRLGTSKIIKLVKAFEIQKNNL